MGGVCTWPAIEDNRAAWVSPPLRHLRSRSASARARLLRAHILPMSSKPKPWRRRCLASGHWQSHRQTGPRGRNQRSVRTTSPGPPTTELSGTLDHVHEGTAGDGGDPSCHFAAVRTVRPARGRSPGPRLNARPSSARLRVRSSKRPGPDNLVSRATTSGMLHPQVGFRVGSAIRASIYLDQVQRPPDHILASCWKGHLCPALPLSHRTADDHGARSRGEHLRAKTLVSADPGVKVLPITAHPACELVHRSQGVREISARGVRAAAPGVREVVASPDGVSGQLWSGIRGNTSVAWSAGRWVSITATTRSSCFMIR